MSQENEIEAKKLSPTTDFLPSDGASCSAWVLISDRAPTAGDCDKWGDLWLWMPAHEKCGPQLGTLNDLHKATHWQKLEDAWKVPSPPNV